MTGRAALVLCLTLAAWPGLAQERPPADPSPKTPAAATRPPERPTEREPDRPDPPPANPAPASQMFGPPPPPTWHRLAGTPAEFDACRLGLTVLGARFRLLPPVTDPENRDCGIARPVQVIDILPGVALSGEPVMRCEAALSLALWTRDFLQPAGALLPDGPRLTGLQTGSAYTCRDRVGTGRQDPKPSEHGYGNAIDVMGFVFDGADPVPVTPRQDSGDTAEAFQRAARATACLLFTTVLGPGSNAAHDDHLHLDMAARNGGWRLCQ